MRKYEFVMDGIAELRMAVRLFDVASTRELDGSDLGCGYEACALLVFNLSHGTIVGIVLGIPVGIVLGPVPIENYAMLFGSWP